MSASPDPRINGGASSSASSSSTGLSESLSSSSVSVASDVRMNNQMLVNHSRTTSQQQQLASSTPILTNGHEHHGDDNNFMFDEDPHHPNRNNVNREFQEAFREELSIYDRLRDAIMAEDFSSPSWKINLLYDVPQHLAPQGRRLVPPSLNDLKDELNTINTEIQALDAESEDENLNRSGASGSTPHHPHQLSSASTEMLIKKAESVVDGLSTLTDPWGSRLYVELCRNA